MVSPVTSIVVLVPKYGIEGVIDIVEDEKKNKNKKKKKKGYNTISNTGKYRERSVRERAASSERVNPLLRPSGDVERHTNT